MIVLAKDITGAADRIYKMAEAVLVNSGKEKWLGLLLFVDVTGRTIKVQSLNNTKRQTFSAFQIKPYCEAFNLYLRVFVTKELEKFASNIFN